jgi:hypothetical protein
MPWQTPSRPLAWLCTVGLRQVPPTASEIAAYQGLHAAAARGDTTGLQRLLPGPT